MHDHTASPSLRGPVFGPTQSPLSKKGTASSLANGARSSRRQIYVISSAGASAEAKRSPVARRRSLRRKRDAPRNDVSNVLSGSTCRGQTRDDKIQSSGPVKRQSNSPRIGAISLGGSLSQALPPPRCRRIATSAHWVPQGWELEIPAEHTVEMRLPCQGKPLVDMIFPCKLVPRTGRVYGTGAVVI